MKGKIIILFVGLLLTNCSDKKEIKKTSDELLHEINQLTTKDPLKTIELLDEYNKLYPDNLEMQALEAFLKMRTGKIEKEVAYGVFRELYKKDSLNDFISDLYLTAVIDEGTPEAALKQIDAALAIAPKSFWYNYERGKKLMELERFEEAISAFDRAQEIEPENRNPYADKALVKYKMGDKEGACKDWRAKECISYLEKYCQLN